MVSRAVVLAFAFLASSALGQTVKLSPILEGATNKIGLFWPVQTPFASGTGRALSPPEHLEAPSFGHFKIQGKTYPFIVDRPDASTYRLFIDFTGKNDFSKCEVVPLETKIASYGAANPAYLWFRGSFTHKIRIAEEYVPVKFFVYLFDKHDPNRPNGKTNLFYYSDFALEGSVVFGTTKFDFILSDPQEYASKPSNDRLRLLFDRKHDRSFSTPEDSYDVDEPFSLGGETMRLASFSFKQGLIEFSPSTERVDEVQIAKPVRKGDIAHSFKTSDSKGAPISFPSDYKGKLVLLHFWGSYSDQAVQSLPRVVAAYDKYHAKGLEVLGLDVEYIATVKNAAKIEKDYKMIWPEVGDHDVSAEVGRWYKIPGVPYLLLVDGATGKVLADDEELKDDGLERVLSKLFVK